MLIWRCWFLCWLEAFIGIQDPIGRYICVGLKRANEIIGTTTEELVLKAKQGNINPWSCFQLLLKTYQYVIMYVPHTFSLPQFNFFPLYYFFFQSLLFGHKTLMVPNSTTHSLKMPGQVHYFQALMHNLWALSIGRWMYLNGLFKWS